MGKTLEVATDRAFDSRAGVIPREMAKGVFINGALGAQATKILHLMIDHAAGRMGNDCWHEMHLRDIRKVTGMRNHDLGSLRDMIHEIAATSFSFEVDLSDSRRKEGIGTFLDGGELVYDREDEGNLTVRWHFGIVFRTLALESNHWAILDRQAFYAMTSKYSLALFQQISAMVRMKHVTSCTYDVADLRQIMGVAPGKVTRWADFNRDALKPALAEISQLTRFDVSARFIKAGRRIEKVVIEWTEKPDLTKVKAEQDRPKVGRKARREGTAEQVVQPFPATGSIRYTEPWATLAKAHGNGKDVSKIGEEFRRWWAPRALDGAGVEKAFIGFCRGSKV